MPVDTHTRIPGAAPVTDLRLTLRCRVRRGVSTLKLAAEHPKNGSIVLIAQVKARRGHSAIDGTVIFRRGRQQLGVGVVNPRTGQAYLDLPTQTKKVTGVRATYAGDGRLASSSAKLG